MRVSALMRSFEIMDLKAQLERDGWEEQTKGTLVSYHSSTHYFGALGLDNPMDGLYKLREVVMKCEKNMGNMEWSFPVLWGWYTVKCNGQCWRN